jgi:16S rRNA (guanine(966)-N(2))-methyltransferase RsmD
MRDARGKPMRVIGGELRGRRIEAPPGLQTRPTAARVREALFSILGDLEGVRVLDLFAGSGALGIEALSRGARYATFVDNGDAAVRAITLNRERLGLEERSQLVQADLRTAALPAAHGPYDIVLIDPPYAEARGFGEALARSLPDVLAVGARVVIECDHRAPLSLALPLSLERRYGDTLLRVHHLEET